ncbi:histone RNA hairpin-binding protein [Neocloeon triangulifer]|uniref:histone RNA hairpin-binding protein n=1 Tax=Neocloeon triangulifer TaxID=2078957 RepID=UPI00286F1DB4|nr:histone RNA hairpin-binding protein [Neocloeon triangulifer]
MPNNTRDSPASAGEKCEKSWADLVEEDERGMDKTPSKEDPCPNLDDSRSKALKKIDFGCEESPMKTESPLKDVCNSPELMHCSPVKDEAQSPSKRNSDVTRRLWASPRRRERDSNQPKLGLAVSPRRPLCPPDSPAISPQQKDNLKRKRPQDLFKCSSPGNSLCSSPGDRGIFSPRPKKKTMEPETDVGVLSRRAKQIEYGKNTEGYRRYLEMVPKNKRLPDHPQTPPREIQYSRRAWDGCIRKWRQQLHTYDPPEGDEGDLDNLDNLDTMSEASVGNSSAISDNHSEISYPGSGTKKGAQRPPSTISLDEYPPLK